MFSKRGISTFSVLVWYVTIESLVLFYIRRSRDDGFETNLSIGFDDAIGWDQNVDRGPVHSGMYNQTLNDQVQWIRTFKGTLNPEINLGSNQWL